MGKLNILVVVGTVREGQQGRRVADWYLRSARLIEHMIQVLHFLGVTAVPDHITINAIWEALNEEGSPKPGYRHGSIERQLAELTWWAEALAVARRSAPSFVATNAADDANSTDAADDVHVAVPADAAIATDPVEYSDAVLHTDRAMW